MIANKSLSRFEQAHASWTKALPGYTLEQLLAKPTPSEWSLGQVYVHLVQSTLGFQLGEAKRCTENPANADKSKNFRGFLCYKVLGGFPPVKIKVPASPDYTPAQPESIEQLQADLARTLDAMRDLESKVAAASTSGKTEHPGFSWLNAAEWYELVPMHWNHHFRQKKQLDAYLRDNGK